MERSFYVEQSRYAVNTHLCFKCAVLSVIKHDREGTTDELHMLIKKVKGGDPMFCNTCNDKISYD